MPIPGELIEEARTESERAVNPRRSWKRLDVVDLLRGLAILFVLLNHVNMRLRIARIPYGQGLPDQVLSSLVWNGQRGVQMFFAISGFLIASTSIRRWGNLGKIRPRDFYLLRFARIAPLLCALLIVLALLHTFHVPNFTVPAKTGGLGRALLAAVTFHVNVLEARRGYLPGNWDILWSLSVEEVFYLFFPLICVLLGRGKKLIVLLLIFVILGPFARTVWSNGNETWQEYSYLGGMDAIALGCLTALLTASTQFSRSVKHLLLAMGIALLVMTLCFTNWMRATALNQLGLSMTMVAIATCMIVAVSAQTGWRVPIPLRPLTALGQRSYEVYLTHMFLVFLFFQLFLKFEATKAALIALFIVVIATSGTAGELVARVAADPMNRLRRIRFGDGPHSLGSVAAGT
jgi:peptidoglycan/LPS O-acetylase OafA/YrhL